MYRRKGLFWIGAPYYHGGEHNSRGKDLGRQLKTHIHNPEQSECTGDEGRSLKPESLPPAHHTIHLPASQCFLILSKQFYKWRNKTANI